MSSDVVLAFDSSRAVPGLVYVWGSHEYPCDNCSMPQAVVVTRNGRPSILRTETDWARAVRGWTPSTPVEAIRACTELLSTTSGRREELTLIDANTDFDGRDSTMLFADPTRKWADTSLIPRGLSWFTWMSDSGAAIFRRNRTRIHPPRAERTDDASWTVTLWVVKDNGAFQYRCSLPHHRWWRRARAHMFPADSLAWPPPPPMSLR